MSSILRESEIKLLELFSSPQYFGKMRDKWEETILHAESCLDQYMLKLALTHRSSALPEQADIVWGHRVLPNFRYTLDQLNKAFILLTHGNSDALGYSDNVRSDFKGQLDYRPDWMSEEDQKKYNDNMNRATSMAHNISITEHASWDRVEPSLHSDEHAEFPILSMPCSYRVKNEIFVRSGEKTQVTGIYIPDVDNCSPQFLGNRKAAPLTKRLVGIEELLDPRTGEKYAEQGIYKEVECTWYLVESYNDNQISNSPPVDKYQRLRVTAGKTCPKAGFYFAPARPDSRKLFAEGEVMPSLDSTYGETIWQWDESQ